MPDLGTNVEEMKLVEWLKQEGDPVQRGEALCEVETDKATDELESVAEGVLLRQMVPAGSEVRCGMVIAYLGQPGESIPEPHAGEPAEEHKCPMGTSPPRSTTGPRVSPVVRNLAEREGIDLDSVTGTGPGGRITRDDVMKARREKGTGPICRNGPRPTFGRCPASHKLDLSPFPQGVPLPKEQLAVARQVSRSNREIPTIDLAMTVDMSAVVRARKELEEQFSEKVAYDSFFLFAVAQGIKQFPVFAGHASDECLFPHAAIDVCVAVSREEKLYLPVVRKAEELSPGEIDREIRRLVEKTRHGRLRPDDLAGGCFTVSNLGMYGVDSFQMIIPPEQSGALAIGAIDQRLSVIEGQVATRPVCTVVLSVDHRMINGALAAEFLAQLKEALETL
jgi:pyruvate dehydrogenase E2 component (dihydrolipoamide acetyltransferase)